jgi:hypothetical protein
MVEYGGVFSDELGSRWACLSCDGNFIFQGHHIGVTSQLKSNCSFRDRCELHVTH